MRTIHRVSCPYTVGQLNEAHRLWCASAKGKHCLEKDCEWKEKNHTTKTTSHNELEQGRLW